MVKIVRNLSPDPGTTGGDGGTTGGNPNGGTAPTLTPEQIQKQETEELQALLAKQTPTDVEKTRLSELQTKYEIKVVDADGKPLTPEQLKAAEQLQAKLTAILAKPEDQWTPEEKKLVEENEEKEGPLTPDQIYEAVDKINDYKLDIDYGDVDPHSPDGIALREQTIFELAQESYEDTLKSKYPRAWNFLVHLINGGAETDFFKETNSDWAAIKLGKDDKGQQESLIRSALRIKGISSDQIDVLVKHYKDNGVLFETAENELKALQAAQLQRSKQEELQQQSKRLKETQDLNQFIGALGSTLDKGFEGIKLNDKEAAQFRAFIGPRFEYHDGHFISVKKLNMQELAKELKYLYFEFKGGDIKGLSERTAKTQTTRKIKNLINKQVTPKSTSGAAGGGMVIKTLQEIM